MGCDGKECGSTSGMSQTSPPMLRLGAELLESSWATFTSQQGKVIKDPQVLWMSDVRGSHETGFSMSSHRSIRSGLAEPSVIWNQHHC